MNFIYRIGIGSIACIAVACSKDATESAAPVAEPETVIIGCAGAAGADVDVRTQLDDDGLSVRWAENDEIRLWARESGATGFLTGVQNVPFKFAYYSPSWSRAGFKGTIDLGTKEAPTFKAYRTYDYFAVSPAPASVVETRATYTIPAVQTGKFDGCCDIMTAQLRNAKGLKAGDDNPSVNLVFEHHIHLLKFTIPTESTNGLGEAIRAVELTFPCAVVGQLTVDATGETADDLSALTDDKGEGKKVLIEFPKGQEKNVNDTFYAMIVPPPTGFGSDAKIEMRIIGTTGETSADLPIADHNEKGDNKVNQTLAAGHSTLINLNVPAKNTFYTVLRFKVADNTRDDLKGEPNCLGKNTLGERLNFVRLKGIAGTFTDVAPSDNRVVPKDDGATLECIVSDDSDGVYEVIFVSEKLPGSKCPWPVWNRSKAISGQTLGVEYESESAWIRSIPDYSTVQTDKAISFDSNNQCSVDLSIPYFFEEDFSGVNGVGDKGIEKVWDKNKWKFVEREYYYADDNDHKNQAGVDLTTGFDYPGWTGNQVRGGSGSIKIKTRVEATAAVSGIYNGRLDSAPMLYWKDGNNAKKKLQVRFDYRYSVNPSADGYARSLTCGITNNDNTPPLPTTPIQAYKGDYGVAGNWTAEKGHHVSGGKSKTLEVNETPYPNSEFDWIIEKPTSKTRLSWELVVVGYGGKTANHFLELSNLKVSITE